MFPEKAKNAALKTALRTPLNSYRFFSILFTVTLCHIYMNRKDIGSIIRYKKAINHYQKNILFVFNYFLRNSYDLIFTDLIAEKPKKYLNYIYIEGKEYVRQLMDKNTGVILLSGHFGPLFRTLLFKEVFGISVSSFAAPETIKALKNPSQTINKMFASAPLYAVGEEEQFQEALLRKEWISFLNDVPVKKRGDDKYFLFGKNIYLSELPFKISLKYNIPIMFIGITMSKHQYHVSILPMDNFHTQKEGLKKYIAMVERMLRCDPYAGNYIAVKHF